MNIGILTFHWATNYGAVLQCYALQSYLTSIGHNVKVINYKPRQYDESLYKFLRYRKFLRFEEYRDSRNKEKSLIPFRDSHLNQTDRAYTCASVSGMVSQFDVIISGSDQVTNPSFLMSGEGKSIVSPTYFLGFPFEGKRIGYALSFGCVTYPDEARKVASKYIGAFDRISVREASGIDIVKSMGRDDAEVVPDPTLLMEPQFYHSLAGECKPHKQEPYIYSFFIRYIADRKNVINKVLEGKRVLWNNEDDDYTVQGWLSKIKHSEFVVTDSFHCVVMCLKLCKPFVVVTEKEGNIDMNDRFYTLLGGMGFEERIVCKTECESIPYLMNDSIVWGQVDEELSKLQREGRSYLNNIVK